MKSLVDFLSGNSFNQGYESALGVAGGFGAITTPHVQELAQYGQIPDFRGVSGDMVVDAAREAGSMTGHAYCFAKHSKWRLKQARAIASAHQTTVSHTLSMQQIDRSVQDATGRLREGTAKYQLGSSEQQAYVGAMTNAIGAARGVFS
jgi:hypothetical protein